MTFDTEQSICCRLFNNSNLPPDSTSKGVVQTCSQINKTRISSHICSPLHNKKLITSVSFVPCIHVRKYEQMLDIQDLLKAKPSSCKERNTNVTRISGLVNSVIFLANLVGVHRTAWRQLQREVIRFAREERLDSFAIHAETHDVMVEV